MSKKLVPLTPNTFPTLITRKFDALGSNPAKTELEAINELLYAVQEERLVPHEEVQDWKRTEKKVLENQRNYKKETKNSRKMEKYSIYLFGSLIFLLCSSWKIVSYIFEDENPGDPIILLVNWPIDFIAVAIYLACLYGSQLSLKFGIPKHVQPQVLNNEDDDDDWEDTMTSTELQSRQKALVNGWEKLEKERKEHLDSDFLLSIALFTTMIFFGSRVCVMHHITEKSSLFFSLTFLTEPESIFLFVEYIFSVVIFAFFFFQYLEEMKKRQKNGIEKICVVVGSWIIVSSKAIFRDLEGPISFTHSAPLFLFFPTMSTELILLSLSPHKIPIFIARKLSSLGVNPEETDLNSIRDILEVAQEVRVVADKELQECKELEKEILENQNDYKKETKDLEKIVKFVIPLSIFVIISIKFAFKILQSVLEVEFSKDNLQLLSSWKIDLIFAFIFLFLSYDSDLWLNFGTSKPVEPHLSKNEDADDDWEDSMPSTELQSRQKALVNGWEPLRKERVDHVSLNFWCSLARYANIIYFFSLFYIIHEGLSLSRFFSCLSGPEIFFVLVEYFISFSILICFVLQFMICYQLKF